MRTGRHLRLYAGFFILFLLLCMLTVWNLCAGSVPLSPADILRILFMREGDAKSMNIILQIRLPRLLSAALLGGALSVSGFLLQTFFHNPIAGPFVLGISSGAKLVVAFTMILSLQKGFHVSSALQVAAAFAGSMISMGFILLVSRKVHSMAMLVVCGIMISYICSAVTEFAVTFADDSNIVNLHNWSVGSFASTGWDDLKVIFPIVCICLAAAFLLSKPAGAYMLGEAQARTMGVNILLFRAELIVLSSILSACVTAFAGPVSFVGIAVPHLMKGLLRTAKPLLMVPACFMGGAGFCLLCDLIARTAFAPTELSISSVTAVFGAPVVIYIMIRRRMAHE